MTFGDFARNYLNPIFLALRAGFLGGGVFCMTVVFISESAVIAKVIFGILGLGLLWIGIKPWGSGRGLSMNQLK